jgi:transposase InsO family protein
MHRNAPLTPRGRLILVLRVESGRPVAHVAAEMGVSRPTAYKWWRRWREEGIDGLADRSSRPHSCPHRTKPRTEAQILKLRRELKLGPARIGYRLGVPPSTVHRVLVRHAVHRLAWMDRPTGRVIRRYERDQPGELVHVDIKKLGRIPPGGGWRVRSELDHKGGRHNLGYDYVHAAVDDHSRVAYAEVLGDETAETAIGFWRRAEAWLRSIGAAPRAVMTDNGAAYRSYAFRDALGELEHIRTRPYRPQTNGKVERFNRTLLEEWAYVRPYRSDGQRMQALAKWLHLYNHHRCHTAIGGSAPISRVSNLPGHYT